MTKAPKKTVRGVRKIVLEVGWDETPIRIKAKGLAIVLSSMEGFKPAEYRWLDQQRLSLMQRFNIIAGDPSLSEEAVDLHYQFLWKELMTWAETPLHQTRWSKLQVCQIRRREEMRPSKGKDSKRS